MQYVVFLIAPNFGFIGLNLLPNSFGKVVEVKKKLPKSMRLCSSRQSTLSKQVIQIQNVCEENHAAFNFLQDRLLKKRMNPQGNFYLSYWSFSKMEKSSQQINR